MHRYTRLLAFLLIYTPIDATSAAAENYLERIPKDLLEAFYEIEDSGTPTISRDIYPPFDDLYVPDTLSYLGAYYRPPMSQAVYLSKGDFIVAQEALILALVSQGWEEVRSGCSGGDGFSPGESMALYCHDKHGTAEIRFVTHNLKNLVRIRNYPRTCARRPIQGQREAEAQGQPPSLQPPGSIVAERHSVSDGDRKYTIDIEFFSRSSLGELHQGFSKQLEEQGWLLGPVWQIQNSSGSVWTKTDVDDYQGILRLFERRQNVFVTNFDSTRLN